MELSPSLKESSLQAIPQAEGTIVDVPTSLAHEQLIKVPRAQRVEPVREAPQLVTETVWEPALEGIFNAVGKMIASPQPSAEDRSVEVVKSKGLGK